MVVGDLWPLCTVAGDVEEQAANTHLVDARALWVPPGQDIGTTMVGGNRRRETGN
ncbi:hypothetical protein ACGFMK_24400 [Amycolatopsis sp. NPDC049252]|uniref:hypothetical protein n=1 Tax=Amycolatopsis sp. NPDC049252 TaxID=3363933 RepID=UPI003710C943